MAAVCHVCGKGPATGNRVSDARNRTNRRFMPNLQKVRILDSEGRKRRVKVCTRCLKAGKVTKAP